jgi:hypothetical protein
VLSNEAIKVHFSYLRTNIEAVQTQLPSAAARAALAEKVDRLAEALVKLRRSQRELHWFVGILAIIAFGVSIAHTLTYI